MLGVFDSRGPSTNYGMSMGQTSNIGRGGRSSFGSFAAHGFSFGAPGAQNSSSTSSQLDRGRTLTRGNTTPPRRRRTPDLWDDTPGAPSANDRRSSSHRLRAATVITSAPPPAFSLPSASSPAPGSFAAGVVALGAAIIGASSAGIAGIRPGFAVGAGRGRGVADAIEPHGLNADGTLPGTASAAARRRGLNPSVEDQEQEEMYEDEEMED